MSTTRTGLVAGLAVAAALLSGCGTATPGVAAQVGDEEITVREVDQLATEYCQAFQEQFETNGEVVPHRYLRGGILGILTRKAVAEQLAEEYGVGPGDTYQDQLAATRQGVQQLPDEVHEAIITVDTAPAYVEGVQAAVGNRILSEESGTAPKYSETIERGAQAFADWVETNGVEIDPSFGIDLTDSEISRVDTNLSFALSDEALKGGAEAPDPEYAGALPDAQRCG